MAISQAGANVVLADVDPRTLTITAAEIEARLTPQTRAVIPVHLFGQPAEMDAIMAVAAQHDLIVIEDATLAVGAEHHGRRVGTSGLTGCYSFSPGKILGSYGDGGAITTDDPSIAERLRVLRNYGHDPSMTDETGSTRFGGLWKIAAEGFNDRLDTLQAAVLNAKLPTLDDRIAARLRIAQAYNDRLSGLALQTPPIDPTDRHVFRAYTILVDNRDQIRAHLADAGVSTLIYYAPPVHLQPAYAYLNLGPGTFPVTESIADRMMSLPVFPEMTEDQIDRVVTALTRIVPSA
jgi:dTDP-4-amino-4,6-dideoxygalactose transaminase